MLFRVILSALLGLSYFAFVHAEDFQVKRLFKPTTQQLQAEKGKVFIYDGLHSRQIDQALDSQFERIESMMFVRTVVETDGIVQTLDDGC